MRNITGSVARGSDFFDRSAEIAELVHLLERDHTLLLAPRRSGKTSLMYRLKDRPPPGWTVVYTDVESATSEAAFVSRLIAVIREANPPGARWPMLGSALTALLDRFEKVQAGPVQIEMAQAIAADWMDVGVLLFRLMRGLKTPLMLAIDEFPIFLGRILDEGGPERARVLLDWFRALRLGEEVHASGARFLLAGSIGLDAVVSRAGLTATINDLVTFRLGPLTASKAREMLARLGTGEHLALPDAVRDRILHHIDWPVPFHLQLLFSEVLRAHRFREEPLTEALVDRAYESLLAPDKRKHFAHWVERLSFEAPAERALATAILTAAARDPQGVSVDTLAQLRRDLPRQDPPDPDALLRGLEHDGYLARDGARWRFASSLVRDWWLRWQVS